MLSTQLNGGQIAKYRPIGLDGEPIYKNAEAFISALKIHPNVGVEKTNCLAVPRISDDGLNIDWYVPFAPRNGQEHHVISWNSATPQEQKNALAILKDFETCLRKLGRELQRRITDSQSRLMASYLTGQNSVLNLPAVHFPGAEYVYIVDGFPVITFWGFESLGDDLSRSPFDILRNKPKAAYVAAGAAGLAAGAGAFAANNANGIPPFGAAGAPGFPPPPPPQPNEKRHNCPLFNFSMPQWMFRLFAFGLGAIALGLMLWLLLPLLCKLFGSLFGGGGSGLGGAGSGSGGAGYPDSSYTEEKQPQEDPVNEGAGEKPTDEVVLYADAPNKNGDTVEIIIPNTDNGTPTVTLPASANSGGDTNVGFVEPSGEGMPAQSTSDMQLPDSNFDATANGSMAPNDSMSAQDNNSDSAASPVPPVDFNAPSGSSSQGDSPSSGSSAPNAPSAGLNQPSMPSSQNNAAPQGTPNSSSPATEPQKNLSFTPKAIQQQGVKVINGRWNTRSGLMDSSNGRPLQMAYNIQDGKGQVEIFRRDGVKCVADTTASVSSIASVKINTTGKAICPDNRSYTVPPIECTSDSAGQVRCKGVAGNSTFPIQLYSY